MNTVIWLAVVTQTASATASSTRPEVVFSSESRVDGRLYLETLLGQLETTYPPLAAARRKVDAARGDLMSSEGAFDLKVKSKGTYDPTGFYDQATADVMLEQNTTLWGLRLFGGYRWGEDFPIYGAKAATSEAGEVRAGFVLPLWRDGPIDGARLAIQLAELGIDVAGLDVDVKRLEAYEKASKTYFKWLAEGQKLAIDKGMLTLAEARRTFVDARVKQGALASIERVDNERLVVSRQAAVASREGALAGASLDLSLFLRNADGKVIRPQRDLMPPSFPGVREPTQDELRRAVDAGLKRRPEMARLTRARSALVAQRRFHENQRAQAIDLGLEASQDIGDKVDYATDPNGQFSTKNETELKLSMSLQWPVQQRKARGKVAAVVAKIEQVDLQRQFLADAIEVQIRNAHAKLVAAHARSAFALRAYRLTRQLEEAERRRLALGQTTILLVNLREEATAKAAKEVVDALTDYHSARASLAVAAGDRPG